MKLSLKVVEFILWVIPTIVGFFGYFYDFLLCIRDLVLHRRAFEKAGTPCKITQSACASFVKSFYLY